MELDRVIHSENVDEAKARQLANEIADSKTKKIKAMVEMTFLTNSNSMKKVVNHLLAQARIYFINDSSNLMF